MLFRKYNLIKKNSLAFIRLIQSQPTIHPQIQTNGEPIPSFRKALNFPDRIALHDTIGSYTYGSIILSAKELADDISQKLLNKTNERVLFMCPNNVSYLISLWAIWISGQIAIPLSPLHPQNLLLHYTNDSKAQLIISSVKYKDIATRIARNSNIQVCILDDKIKINCAERKPKEKNELEVGLPQKFYNKGNAMILYTSGTTGSPKGVLLNHKNIDYQVNMLINAWKWSENDAILHTLPLHHVHGIVNALLCPLQTGAKIVMLPKFDAKEVWSYLLAINGKTDRKVNVYMAVPTIYSKLIEEYDRLFKTDEKMVVYIKNTLKNKIRLMVSGSAPLSETIFQKWLQISGHELLERYGMTETGMCLSNPYSSKREFGYVGIPLPGVSVKICQKDLGGDYLTLVESHNKDGKVTYEVDKNLVNTDTPSGSLLVKSDGVFQEYFYRPEATKKEFTIDRYFKTGDICQFDTKKQLFKILGRESVDIIKSGGYKISALQIESELLNHPDIRECAIIGLPDEKWGQVVAAVLVLNKDKSLTVDDLKTWASEKLPVYCIPKILKIVDSISRNAMGKINKKDLVKTVFD